MKIQCRFCEKSFSLPYNWNHPEVACPKCGGVNRVSAASASPSLPAATAPMDDDDDLEMRLAPEEARPKIDMLLEPTTPAKSPKPSQAKPGRSTATGATAAAGPASAAAPQMPPKPTPKGKTAKHCPNCNSELPPDGMLCVECGFHMTLGRVLQGDLTDVDLDTSTGFERWFRNQLSEGESATSLLWAMHALVILVLAIVGLVFHPWAWYVVGPLGAAYVAVCVWLSNTQIGGRWAWNTLLATRRRIGWRELTPPFATTRCFVSHQVEFSDAQLGGLPNLATLEVLDLEFTNITDRALRHFQFCDKLRCVVLRNTRMTRGGIKRLQIMKPELSIWYD